MHICRENYLNQKRRLMRRNSSEPFTNRFLVRWVLKYQSGHHCVFVVCLVFFQTDNKCSVYNRTCRFVPMNLEESWRTFWPSVSRTRIAEALERCTVLHTLKPVDSCSQTVRLRPKMASAWRHVGVWSHWWTYPQSTRTFLVFINKNVLCYRWSCINNYFLKMFFPIRQLHSDWRIRKAELWGI